MAARAKRRDFVPLLLTVVFGVLSFAGTFVGLLQIISAGDTAQGYWDEGIVFLLVAVATLGMIYFLRRWASRLWSLSGIISFFAYVGLAFFSITFGFAFYWQRLEAANQAVGGAVESLEDFQTEITITFASLEGVLVRMERLEDEFRVLAETERDVGGTCGVASNPGEGPRMRHRFRRADEISDRVALLRPAFGALQPHLAALQTQIDAVERLQSDSLSLDGELSEDVAAQAGADAGLNDAAREQAERTIILREARGVARDAAAEVRVLSSDQTVKSVAGEFALWADEYDDIDYQRADDPNGTPYICYSPQASQLLSNASAQLSAISSAEVPDLPDYAGAEATREAVYRMLHSVGRLVPAIPFAGSGGGGSGGGNGGSGGAGDGGDMSDEERADLERSVIRSILNDLSQAPDGGGGASGGASTLSEDGGLIRADIFPLMIAIIVDSLLFAVTLMETTSATRFSRSLDRRDEAVREPINPFDEATPLQRIMGDDPAVSLLEDYRFDHDRNVYFVVPQSSEDDPNAPFLRNLAILWSDEGVIQPGMMSQSEARRRLVKSGKRSDFEGAIEVYRLSYGSFANILRQKIYADVETDAAERPGFWAGFRDLFRRRETSEERADDEDDGSASGAPAEAFDIRGPGLEPDAVWPEDEPRRDDRPRADDFADDLEDDFDPREIGPRSADTDSDPDGEDDDKPRRLS